MVPFMCVVHNQETFVMLFLYNYNNQGPSIMQRGNNLSQSSTGHIPFAQQFHSHRGTTCGKSLVMQPVRSSGLGSRHSLDLEKVDYSTRGYQNVPSRKGELRERSDLQGLVLTLGGPGSGH